MMKTAEGREQTFTLKTYSGCRRLLALFLGIIIVCSLLGCLVQTSWGTVKVSNVSFDTRGALQDADLYVPVGTSDRDQLPCIVLSHGGGCAKGVMTGFAQELARRGFVVLNVSSYGSGLSEQPMYDEDGYGIEGMAVNSQGLWDAVNYVRTLKYVDQTRIAVGGHSQGAYRTAYVAMNDCGYLSYNDLMINFMYEEFGIQFTQEELGMDAEALAQKYLNADQQKTYELKSTATKEWVDTRVKAIVPIGSATVAVSTMMRPQTVSVAGHEVSRFVQTNVCSIIGKWDHNYPFLLGLQSIFEGESFPETYLQTGDATVFDTWLQLTDSGVANQLGTIHDTKPASNQALHDAIDARTTRMAIGIDRVTHSLEFLSNATTSAVVNYLDDVFENASPVPAQSIVWQWREYLNTVSMFAMIGITAILAALLLNKSYFAQLKLEHPEASYSPMKGKGMTAAFWIITVVITTITCYWANKGKFKLYKGSKFLPQDGTAPSCFVYLFYTALFLLVLIAVFAVLRKKKEGTTGLEKLGLNIGVKNILKTLLLSFIIMMACYGILVFIEYWFNQDFRWWMCIFTEIQPAGWGQFARYTLIFIPLYIPICMATNYTDNGGKSKHPAIPVVIAVLVGSAGVYINHFINIIGLYSNETLTLLSEASICGGLLMFVPITLYVAKKTYKVTGSIWMGVFLNAMLNAWLWVSAISSTSIYMGTTFAERFFGF